MRSRRREKRYGCFSEGDHCLSRGQGGLSRRVTQGRWGVFMPNPTEETAITVTRPAGGPNYDEKTLADISFFEKRKEQLINARKESGTEERWRQADRDYEPHVIGTTSKKKVLVENERTESSTYVQLDKDAWRSKQSSNNPYQKIQTALSIILD